MSMDFKIEGLDRVLAWFEAEPKKVNEGVAKGLYRSALQIMSESQKIVPVGGPPTSPYDPAPGTLRASGTVLLPETNGNTVTVELGYGGAAEAYAWRQHEDLTFRHKDGQQAKYLETPLLADESNILDRIADAIQE